MPFEGTWMDLEINISSEVRERQIPYEITYMGNLKYDTAAAASKSLQSCSTRWDPIDGSPVGSAVPGILQARTLEWAAMSFSNAWKWKVKVKSLSPVWLLGTPWTAAYQAPPSMGISRQEYWSRLPLPSPKIWYKWTYIWNRNKLTGIENRLVVAKGEGGWERVGLGV